MAINTNFRVKNGLYVGTDIDASRGALSALSANVGGGYGATGLTVSSIGDLSANGIGHFDGNLSTSGGLTVGGGYGDTGVSVSTTGDLSANGTITGTSFAGNGTNLTSNFIISAGGDVDDVTTNVTALNGTYSLNLELTNQPGLTAGSYGSATAIPTFTVDEDGRLTAAGSASITTTLNTAGDSGTGSVALDGQTLTFAGTSNEIETSVANQTVTIGLPDNVTVAGDLTVSGNDIKDSGGSPALSFDGSQNTTAKGNLTVVGDFTVSGDTTTQNVSTVLVEDPVIKLANGNTADSLDIGFYGQYRVGVGSVNDRYAGVIRDITFAGGNKPFVFFDGTETDILSANASGSGKPGLSKFADVYMGRVGINTTDYNATTRLKINLDNGDNIHFDGAGDLFVDIDRNASSNAGRLRYQTNGTDEFEIGLIGGTAGYHITDGSVNPLLTVLSDGKIGIGTPTPNEKLTVSGNISADGNLTIDGTANFKGNVTLGDASGDTLTINAETINPANIAAGTDNTVVVYNGSSLVTDEINSRVWGNTLVDGSGTQHRLTKWTETGDTVGDSRLSDNATDIVVGVGAANPVTFTGSSTDTSVKYNDTTGYHSLSAALPATCNNLPVFTKSATSFRSSKVIVQSVLGSTQYEIAELLLIHNGTNVYITEYGNISTGSGICTTYSADINAGSVRILASNAHASVDSVVTTSVQQFLI